MIEYSPIQSGGFPISREPPDQLIRSRARFIPKRDSTNRICPYGDNIAVEDRR